VEHRAPAHAGGALNLIKTKAQVCYRRSSDEGETMNDPASRTPRSADFAEYLRVLLDLLKKGDEGRFALVHRGKLVSVWDTAGDALQTGIDRFGTDADFLTQPVSRKDLDAGKRGTRRRRRTARS
jgi:hypothetical protein